VRSTVSRGVGDFAVPALNRYYYSPANLAVLAKNEIGKNRQERDCITRRMYNFLRLGLLRL